jgi:hypothetical protein
MKTQAVLITALILTTSCSDSSEQASNPLPDNLMTVNQDIAQFELVDKPLPVSQPNPDRNAYFGDLHVHTEYSLDAYAYGTTATPADAYRYAQGEAINHPSGYQVQLSQPLDFYAVTDHAFFLGLAKEAGDTSSEFSRNEAAEPFHDLNAPGNDGSLDLLLRVRALGKFARGVRTEYWTVALMNRASMGLQDPPGSDPSKRPMRPTSLVCLPPSRRLSIPRPLTNERTCTAM